MECLESIRDIGDNWLRGSGRETQCGDGEVGLVTRLRGSGS